MEDMGVWSARLRRSEKHDSSGSLRMAERETKFHPPTHGRDFKVKGPMEQQQQLSEYAGFFEFKCLQVGETGPQKKRFSGSSQWLFISRTEMSAMKS